MSGSAPVEKDDDYGKNVSRKVALIRDGGGGLVATVAVRWLDDDVDHDRILVWPCFPLCTGLWFHRMMIAGSKDLSTRSARDGPCLWHVLCTMNVNRENSWSIVFQDEVGS